MPALTVCTMRRVVTRHEPNLGKGFNCEGLLSKVGEVLFKIHIRHDHKQDQLTRSNTDVLTFRRFSTYRTANGIDCVW